LESKKIKLIIQGGNEEPSLRRKKRPTRKGEIIVAGGGEGEPRQVREGGVKKKEPRFVYGNRKEKCFRRGGGHAYHNMHGGEAAAA